MPADADYLRGLVIEPFDAARHERAAFTCGTDRIDNFPKITALTYLTGDIGGIWVGVEMEEGRLGQSRSKTPLSKTNHARVRSQMESHHVLTAAEVCGKTRPGF